MSFRMLSLKRIINILPFLFLLVHFFFLLEYFKENLLHLCFTHKYFSIHILKKQIKIYSSGAFSSKVEPEVIIPECWPRFLAYQLLIQSTS